jgi:hypothetical protein
MSDQNAVVGIFDSHLLAESAVQDLQHKGMNLKQLSIIGSDKFSNERVVGYYHTGDRMMYWGERGAFWGGLWGLLLGAGFFWVPGVGPLLLAGPLVGMVIGAIEGAAVVGGLTALGAVLVSVGIPEEHARTYETAIRSGKYVLIFHGSAEEIHQAHQILESAKAAQTELYLHAAALPTTR